MVYSIEVLRFILINIELRLADFLKLIQGLETGFSDYVKIGTKNFTQSNLGRISICCAMFGGPIALFPTFWAAWTVDNIDAIRTPTWPIILGMNILVYIALCRTKECCLRLGLLCSTFMVGLIVLALIIR